MDSYIPNVAEPPVPIPFGELSFSVAETITPEHPIIIDNPIALTDFPNTPQGAVAFTALQHVQELLSHGFMTDTNISAPYRELWLAFVSQLSVYIHNSICHTHADTPLPNAFANLTPDEYAHFSLLTKTFSSLKAFFDDRTDNGNDKSLEREVCIRCLEECQFPVDKACYQSVLMTCAQNIKAAHRTIINDRIQSLTTEMDEWVQTRQDQIKSDFINAVVSDDLSSLHSSNDPRLITWANDTLASFQDTAKQFMVQTVMNDTINPLFLEQITAAKVKADQEGEECLDAYIRDERAKAEAAANHNALIFYNETLANLKAEASERSEREIAEFKSSLKVRNEERKAALLVDFEKRAPKPSSQPTSTAN